MDDDRHGTIRVEWAGRQHAVDQDRRRDAASTARQVHAALARTIATLPAFDMVLMSQDGRRLSECDLVRAGSHVTMRPRAHVLHRSAGAFMGALREALDVASGSAERQRRLARAAALLDAVAPRIIEAPFGRMTDGMIHLAMHAAEVEGVVIPRLDEMFEPYVIRSLLTMFPRRGASCPRYRDVRLAEGMARLLLRRARLSGQPLCATTPCIEDVAALMTMMSVELDAMLADALERTASVLFAVANAGVAQTEPDRDMQRRSTAALLQVIRGRRQRVAPEPSGPRGAPHPPLATLFPHMPVMTGIDEDDILQAPNTVLDIDRTNVLGSTYRQVMGMSHDDVVRDASIDVMFDDANGVGLGVAREWISSAFRELARPVNGVFDASPTRPHVLHPCPRPMTAMMELAGRITGLALRLGATTGYHLSKAAYRLMCDPRASAEVSDLEDHHPGAFASVRAVLACPDQASLDALLLPGFALGSGSLLPGLDVRDAAEVRVTLENREALAQLTADRYVGTDTGCRQAMCAFRAGLAFMAVSANADVVMWYDQVHDFFRIIAVRDPEVSPAHVIAEVVQAMSRTPLERFNALCGGDVVITADAILDRLRVTGERRPTTHRVVRAFCAAVYAMDPEERRRLLQFWTGASSMAEDARLELCLQRTDDHGRLPHAHTCYMQMVLYYVLDAEEDDTDGEVGDASSCFIEIGDDDDDGDGGDGTAEVAGEMLGKLKMAISNAVVIYDE